jgi:VanZ family protein
MRVPGAGTSSWLATVAAGLIIYATLYPMTGWDHPAGWSAWRVVTLPWPARATRFDLVVNVLGYMPLGVLLLLALARDRHWPLTAAAVATLVLGAALSLVLELLQNFLPRRVPSAIDWACNSAGVTAGLVLALLAQRLGVLDAWAARHERWFRRGSAGGTTLLVLWPLALLFPAPVPLGLGQVFDRLAERLTRWVAGTPVEPMLLAWTGGRWSDAEAAALARAPLTPGTETLLVAAAMLAPCMIAFTMTRVGWRRAVLAGGAAALAIGGLSLSAALNFGPQHAFAWQTPQVLSGIALGAALACACAWVPHRVAAALGLVAVTASVSLVATAPVDPYFALSLAAWEQGRFIQFHGASQWIGWLWPYGAAIYLFGRIGRADEPPRTAAIDRRQRTPS